jgi:hypothetical protein
MVQRPSSVSSSTATRHTGRTCSAAVPDCAGSRVLVALTVQLPVVSGAVYSTLAPVPVRVPQVAVHVTPVLAVPDTVAVSVARSPRNNADLEAATVTRTGVTVTAVFALRDGSAALATVMV